MAESKGKPMTAVLLLLVIVAAIVVGVVLSKKPKEREKQQYDYTIYGIASDGTVYKWVGHSPEWPIVYQGKELLPLYGCDKGHKFAGVAKGMTTHCPICGSPNVGGYDEELHGPVNATAIKIESPE